MDFVENVGRRSEVAGDNGDFINVGVFSLNGYERNALYHNRGNGKFFDSGYLEGADRLEDGRGLGLLDLDQDGDVDIACMNYSSRFRLLVNHAPVASHWLRLQLRGTRSTRSAIGARVEIRHGVRRQYREVSSTAGYLSGQSLYLHFGLGLESLVDRLIVHWPSGLVEEIRALDADHFYRIVEGTGVAEPVFPMKSEAPALVPTAGKAE